jgi:V/A-type H+-transporting ATPase subunit C
MDNVTRFAAVNTKIKTMEGMLLKDEDYKNLLKLESVAAVAKYLKESSAYSDVLANVDVQTVHRGMLENLVKQKMVKSIDSLIHYFTGDYKAFIKTLYARYEIEELKAIARAAYNSKDAAGFRSSAFLGKFSKLDADRLFAARQVRDIIFALEGTEYYKFLIPLVDGNVTENLFRFEMVMDMAYYSILQKEWSKLSKRDMAILQHAQGVIADLLNIQWIYRGKKFYKLSPEEILNYTINIGYRLNFNLLKELCYTQSLEEFHRIVHNTRYGFLFKKDETTDIYMERRMERHIFFELKAMARSNSLSVISAFAFIMFLEYEVKDIISIVEAIRYEIPIEQAHRYVVRKL